MWLFFAFIAVPLIEIALFVTVGGAIGLWPTLAIVLLTAVIGTQLMRRQGIMTLQKLQISLAEGGNPTDPMAQGAMILVAGVLLLTPGFFTDAIGLLLLMAPVRAAIIRWVAGRIGAQTVVFTSSSAEHSRKRRSDDVIDADYSVLDDGPQTPPENPSGWTKH